MNTKEHRDSSENSFIFLELSPAFSCKKTPSVDTKPSRIYISENKNLNPSWERAFGSLRVQMYPIQSWNSRNTLATASYLQISSIHFIMLFQHSRIFNIQQLSKYWMTAKKNRGSFGVTTTAVCSEFCIFNRKPPSFRRLRSIFHNDWLQLVKSLTTSRPALYSRPFLSPLLYWRNWDWVTFEVGRRPATDASGTRTRSPSNRA